MDKIRGADGLKNPFPLGTLESSEPRTLPNLGTRRDVDFFMPAVPKALWQGSRTPLSVCAVKGPTLTPVVARTYL